MSFALFRRRTVWAPTWFGALVLAGIPLILAILWVFEAEAFLASSNPVPAKVIIVEGWTVGGGVATACAEFKRGGYDTIVATGSLSGEPGDSHRWDYSVEAEEQILRLGIPASKLIRTPAGDPETQRTFAMAVAAYRGLKSAGIVPDAINVVTRGSHARRSRLVYAKVFGPAVKVGVISWHPPVFKDKRWWHSSERAKDVVLESLGFVFELCFNSGRASNSPN